MVGGLRQVLVECLEHQLHTGRERDELVWPRADRCLLEPVLPHLLDVLLWDDPAGATCLGIEGQEVRPRILQLESDMLCVDRLDARNTLFH